MVGDSEAGIDWPDGVAIALASPQSMTVTSPKSPMMTLSPFRSRWMTPWAWA